MGSERGGRAEGGGLVRKGREGRVVRKGRGRGTIIPSPAVG